MFVWTIQWIIISLVLICLLHYLYFFLIDTLTVPKIRDLIHTPSERKHEVGSSSPPNDMQYELRQFLDNISKKEPIEANYSKF